jgi:hypothetical protein
MTFSIQYRMDVPPATLRRWQDTPPDDHATEQDAVTKLDRDWQWAWDGDRLSADFIKELTKGAEWPVYEQDIRNRHSSFTERPLEQTMQGLSVPLVREVLRIDPSVKSILEIGAYYGYILSELAREYPEVRIHGVDLPWAMEKINAGFSEPNLSFSTGYALADFESRRIAGELVLTVSTALRMRGAELKRCVDLMVENGTRWYVGNEVMVPHQNGVVPDPCGIDPDQSLPVVYKSSGAGMPPCYAHNYKAILEQRGFQIVHYRAYAPLAPEEYRLEIVARR